MQDSTSPLRNRNSLFGWLAICLCCVTASQADDPPSAELSLSLKPVHDVEIDTPEKSEYDKCQVKIENSNKGAGWVVYGPQGQVVRRFVDTNRNGVVDLWRYYKNGMEVYRDIDSNHDKKVDQSRWLNTGGTRWGVDTDQNGTIDEWKMISAEEATREAVLALVEKNPKRLAAVMITKSEISKLGVSSKIAGQLEDSIKDIDSKVREESSGLNPKTLWLRFDSSMLMPNLIPEEDGKASKDLYVYENVMSITQVEGNDDSTGFVRIGEMIRIGDVWKLTQVPKVMKGDTLEMAEAGFLMQPETSQMASNTAAPQMNPELRKGLEQLRELDAKAPNPASGQAAMIAYNRKRIEILNSLVGYSKTEEERHQWLQQMIDGIAAAVQSGTYPPGVAQLKSIEQQLTKATPDSDLIPYTEYRRLLAEYSTQLQNPSASNEDRQKVQEWWYENLEDFIKDHPKADDANDARLQLAMAMEFNGKIKDAISWYQQVSSNGTATPQSERAQGALRRLQMTGKTFEFSGKQLGAQRTIDFSRLRRGPVLVLFWSTWCQPCTEDLPQIQKLYQEYRPKGFEIIGVNLDSQEELVIPFVQKNRIPWPHIFEPGGLESRPAKSFGIISVPTMFLIDAKGKVVSRATSVDELKRELPKLIRR